MDNKEGDRELNKHRYLIDTELLPTLMESYKNTFSILFCRYANIRSNGEPVNEEPILAMKKSRKNNKQDASVPLEDIPAPPYMPMQPSTSKKSASLERRIKKKKEKEGCKQQ